MHVVLVLRKVYNQTNHMLLDAAVNHAIHKDEASQVYKEAILAQPAKCVSRLIAAARLVEEVHIKPASRCVLWL